jgi:hypothetical protein
MHEMLLDSSFGDVQDLSHFLDGGGLAEQLDRITGLEQCQQHVALPASKVRRTFSRPRLLFPVAGAGLAIDQPGDPDADLVAVAQSPLSNDTFLV